ncbi:hypothetical protein [Nocardiopsis sp. MG754419]|uniref:hypothetical protein n=1 Tax=Nocardiopsis sp. MG754419 TaxID=2259865 RepID=UPI001BAC5E2A|nr:hypothetical protein [Nocardiopsis sp. MG754419]
MAVSTEGLTAVNRPSIERPPTPPHPRPALAACAAPPVVAVFLGLETEMFGALSLSLGNGAVLLLGYVVFLVALFPLLMPPDVRHLAALVSAALLTPAALVWLVWSAPIGVSLLPVVALLFLAWALNHPRFPGGRRRVVVSDDEPRP